MHFELCRRQSATRFSCCFTSAALIIASNENIKDTRVSIDNLKMFFENLPGSFKFPSNDKKYKYAHAHSRELTLVGSAIAIMNATALVAAR